MKKKLGALVLAVSSLVLTAACASTGGPSKPTPPQPDDGQTWAKAGPSVHPSQPANATAVPMRRLAK